MEEKCNVLMILSDDQGVWASGCYGNEEIITPNIDKLAENGVRFENFFVSTPVCSPSRATLLTGKIPSQHGIHDWIKPESNIGKDAIRFLENQICYTDILSKNGWVCGISGKWHIGDASTPQHGFTDWYVHQKGGGDYNKAPMVKDGSLIIEEGYITDKITDKAIEFIRKYVKNSTPFYLSVHYTAPHDPWIGHPEQFVSLYDKCLFRTCPQEKIHPWAIDRKLTINCLGNKKMLVGYFAAVTAMDYNIGKLLKEIEILGIKEKTLVIFMSDNGFSCGHHGFWGKGNGTNPRNMYEYSIKVPCIFSHPSKLPTEKIIKELISAYDFMPTLLDYLSLPIPNEKNLPGKSFLCLLKGRKKRRRNKEVYIFDEYGPVRMIRTEEWKYVYRHAYGPDELYNLLEDSDERENLINKTKYSDIIKKLKKSMDDWFSQYVIPSRNGLKEDGKIDGR